MTALPPRSPGAPLRDVPVDHERQQEMPMRQETMDAWADLYDEAKYSDLSPTRMRRNRATQNAGAPSAIHRSEVDSVMNHIRETEILCQEIDRLRSSVLFANTELTEVLNLYTTEKCDEERNQWKQRYAWRKKQEHEKRQESQQEAGDEVFYRVASDADIAAIDVFARKSFRDTFFEACGYTEEDLQQYFDDTYRPLHWRELLHNPKRHVLVAYTQNSIDRSGAFLRGQIVGYACVGGPTDLPVDIEDEARERCGDLLRCYVDPSVFGRGVAKRLVDMGLKWLLPRFTGDVYIGVWSENWRAQSFYKKYGAKVVKEYLYPVGDKHDKEYVMRCDRIDIEAYMKNLEAFENKNQFQKHTIQTNKSIDGIKLDLDLSSVLDVNSEDSNEVMTADQMLMKYETRTLRPLLKDLAKLKWGVFHSDYDMIEAHVAISTASTPLCSQKPSAATHVHSTESQVPSYERPHHSLFLEHLGMFSNALLLGAKVAEIRKNWNDCACIYSKVIDFMTYSGRYTDHTGISVNDLVTTAQRRYAINAVSASDGPTPPHPLAEPRLKLSIGCNFDISRVCVWCAIAYFSACNFAKSKIMATKALQSLALVPPSIGASGLGNGRQNGYDSHHTVAPSIVENLNAAKKGLPPPPVGNQSATYSITSLSYDRTYQEAQSLLRYFSSLEYKQRSK